MKIFIVIIVIILFLAYIIWAINTFFNKNYKLISTLKIDSIAEYKNIY